MDRLDELALLIAILDAGTLAGAARNTGRSAASVTRILGELEQRVGVRLIERSTRRLAPTAAGQLLAGAARPLLLDYEEALVEAAGDASEPRGTLRLSAPLMFGRLHIAPLALRFQRLHPQVQVELHLTNRVVDMVDAGIDLAVRIAHLDDCDLVARRLGTVRRVLVASPDYLARCGTPAHPDDLAAHATLLQSASKRRPEWHFDVQGASPIVMRPDGRFVVDQAETVIAAALGGHGLARVLSYQVAQELAAGTLVRVLQAFEPAPVPVHLVFAQARRQATRLRAFVDYAVDTLRAQQVLAG